MFGAPISPCAASVWDQSQFAIAVDICARNTQKTTAHKISNAIKCAPVAVRTCGRAMQCINACVYMEAIARRSNALHIYLYVLDKALMLLGVFRDA